MMGSKLCSISNKHYERIGHQQITIKNNVLLIGGGNYYNQLFSSILYINQHYHTQLFSYPTLPPLQYFSLVVLQCGVYLWGGQSRLKASNQLWRVKDQLCSNLQQKGSVPPPRYSHATAIIPNSYMIVYGGCDGQRYFNDWYMLDLVEFSWVRLKPTLTLPTSYGSVATWGAGRGFLWVGEYIKDGRIHYGQFYEFRVTNYKECILAIDKIEVDGIKPMGRSLPVLMNMDKVVLVMGGDRLSCQQGFCDDIWMFNTCNYSFSRSTIRLNAKCGFTCSMLNSSLLIAGGIKSQRQLSKQLQIISIDNSYLITPKICSSCKNIFPFYESPVHLKLDVQSTKEKNTTFFYSKLSYQIQNPMHALLLLIDNSTSTQLQIQLHTRILNSNYFKQHSHYIVITDNSNPFINPSTAQQNHYWFYLKVGALRLGSSCLMISRVDAQVTVIYFSKNTNDCPQINRQINYFTYHIQHKIVYRTHERQIIKTNISHLFNISQLQSLPNNITQIYIMDVTELEKTEQPFPDILTIGPQKSLRLLLKRQYLSINNHRSFFIGNCSIKLQSITETLSNHQSLNYIYKIDLSYYQHQFKKISLYYSRHSNHNENQIWVYYKNKMVDTIATNHLMICGVVELKDTVTIPLLKNTIPLNQYNKIIGLLTNLDGKKRKLEKQIQNEGEIVETKLQRRLYDIKRE